MTYRELAAAVELFQLGRRATLGQIKARHRELVKTHHPDHGGDGDPAIIRAVNEAYRLLTAYCRGYRYCFNETEFLEQFPGERMRRQFGWDPVWGGSGDPAED